MKASDIPTKFPAPFANAAPGSNIRAIPATSQIGIQDGAASIPDGFPPNCFLPVGAGGIPPWGADMNGLMNQETAWARWLAAGGPLQWDSAFSTVIGGYPSGAVVASVTLGLGFWWISLADDNATNPDTGGANWRLLIGGLTMVSGQCHLKFVSTTSINLIPYNGSYVIINGLQRQIPSAGVSAANTGVYINGTAGQNLAALTFYWVYLFNNAGTLTLDFCTTGHQPDTAVGNNGVEIKIGDPTRALVGMVYTDISSLFAGKPLVRSWFNRRPVALAGNFLSVNTGNTYWTDLSSSLHVSALVWAGEIADISIEGAAYTNVGSGGANIALGINGVVETPPSGLGPNSTGTSYASGYDLPCTVRYARDNLTDGLYTWAAYGSTLVGAIASYSIGIFGRIG